MISKLVTATCLGSYEARYLNSTNGKLEL